MAPLTFLGTLAHDLVYVYNDITSFFLAFHFFILFVQHCTVLVTPVLTRDSLVKFFKIIESAQEALFNLNIRQPRSPSMLSQICWLAFFTVPLLMSIVVSTFSPISYSTAAISVAHPIVFYGTLSKMRIMMQLVKEKFDLLNWHLDDLNNRWPLFLPRPPDVTCSEFICVEKWRKTKYVHYDENHRQITSLKIEAFNRAHIKLCYAFHTLNYVFSVDSLVMTLCVGTIVMGECFSAITNPYNLQWRYTPYFIVSAIHIATSFITVLTVATNIKEQAHKTALLVHDLLDERDYPPDVFDELEGFSQALLHRKISFSAGGFFELDLKLLPRMASLMAPITLFLIQNNNRLLAFRNKPSV
ncbi:putative gustatory receptor 28b [Homalodisca vitripennis]|uniref:putative gustatory receptor 28b n=1 Tax=Homalodisca vitripennis TaxID=197043 RepID=UPI001EEBC91B|nr:putative gustatory receptor 28b [Homalodisca vitripennis]